ncbi:hypothetical protein HJC23_005980 [Cyclotella cryptica]|uniref:HSF-type DNA-binding domain-containing protein n=1 Tax=Cyclotella cryptica TaxID=29204 RepID=A0ABD3NSN8_9STRA|eukprot:CCRYP_019955-RA/>CCRYP_019955-RA protein AED:0.14 eAED:0.16 QI:0/1/0.5/1/1/1/2/79/580
MSEPSNDNNGDAAPFPPPRKKRAIRASLIDHTYIDYSNYLVVNTNELKKGHSSTDNFPRKLHYILSRPEYHHIISWMPHGRAWKIWNKKLLVSVVCKKLFKHEKFESFNRQVNGWGFKRLLRNGPDYKCYYNQFFLRGLPDLTSHMHRLDKPGKRLPNKSEEPDLYEITCMFPLPEINSSCKTEVPRKYDSTSSKFCDSKTLTVPYIYSTSSEQCPARTYSFDGNDRGSIADAMPSHSTGSAVPKVASRTCPENKPSQWQLAPQIESDSSQHKWNASISFQDDQVFHQEMKIPSAISYPSEATQSGKGLSNSTRSDENYKAMQEHNDYHHRVDQEESQQNHIEHSQGQVVILRSIQAKNEDHNLTMSCTSSNPHSNEVQYQCYVPHYNGLYPTWYQGFNDAYSDSCGHHCFKSTVPYMQSYPGSENNAQNAPSYSSRHQYHYQVQPNYEFQYPMHQMHGTKDQWDDNKEYNDSFHPYDNNSNEYSKPNTYAVNNPHHHHIDVDTHHHFQPLCVSDQRSQGGPQSLHDNKSKLLALNESFQSSSDEDISPCRHHSLSPLSSLMDLFVDFEPSQSIFDDKSK